MSTAAHFTRPVVIAPTRTRASLAGTRERSAASTSVSNRPTASPVMFASTAACSAKRTAPLVSTVPRICGSQSQRFPAAANCGVPMAAGLIGLSGEMSGISCPIISSPFVHRTAPRAVRMRSSGNVRPPLLGCCPPKKSTSRSPMNCPPRTSREVSTRPRVVWRMARPPLRRAAPARSPVARTAGRRRC
ncbi:MAG: hypothetical protein ABIT20_19100 [Gemmatimonadaceae bacterium]